jgi:hypothetical protein
VFVLFAAAIAADHAVEPLPNAHAHNDYWHARPLDDALDQGFSSVEADVFLVDGKLHVGHEQSELRLERTLESLYLAPLARRVRENKGRVHNGGERFLLLVDIKSDADKTYKHLCSVLSKYGDMLTTWEGARIRRGAITVVISGNRPHPDAVGAGRRFAGLDGRLSDLDSDVSSHVMPMISDNWRSHFTWNGDGHMPEDERAKLKEFVGKAHAAARWLRFWGTAENESVWRELRSAGVDLIGTDQLERLRLFLRANDSDIKPGNH